MIQGPNQQYQPAPHPSFWRRNLIWIILLAVPFIVPSSIFLFWQASGPTSEAEPVGYTLFIAEVKDHNVTSVTLENNSVTGMFKTPVASDKTHASGTQFMTTLPNSNEDTVGALLANGVTVNTTNDSSNNWSTFLLQGVPLLLLAVPLYVVIVGCLALYFHVFHGRPRPPAERAAA